MRSNQGNLTSPAGLTALAAAVSVLLLVVAGLAYSSLQRAFSAAQTVTTEITRQTEATLRLQRQLEKASLPVHHYHMAGEEKQREHFARISGEVEELLRAAIDLRTGEDRATLEQAREQWRDAQQTALSVLALPNISQVPLDRVHHELHTTDTKMKAVVASIDIVHERDRNRIAARLDQLRKENLQLITLVIGTFVSTLLVTSIGALIIWRNRTALKELSVRDGLTGLYNRREFQSRLHRALTHAERSGSPCSLLLLDIDHFKSVNDMFGHQCGDEVLQNVAWIVSQSVRRTDSVARFGGEELAVILPDTTAEMALSLAERIRVQVAAARFTCLAAHPDFSLTVSVGAATHPTAHGRDTLISAADAALYLAKQSGRNQVQSHRPTMNAPSKAAPA